jgi:SAM-dependent methyltransferase
VGADRRLAAAGAALALAGLALLPASIGGMPLRIPAALAAVIGMMVLGLGLSRLAHARLGAARLRDRLLADIAWTGAERVLDLGEPPGAMAAAVRPLLAGGRVATAAAGRLDLPDRSMDVVLMAGGLSRLPPALARVAAAEAARVLAPGGRLLVADRVAVGEIAAALAEAGLTVEGPVSVTLTALTPMWRLAARRPA